MYITQFSLRISNNSNESLRTCKKIFFETTTIFKTIKKTRQIIFFITELKITKNKLLNLIISIHHDPKSLHNLHKIAQFS